MATETMNPTLGAALRQVDAGRSFKDEIVDQNQTLLNGHVVAKGTGGRMVHLGAAANCVQTIGITGTLSAGSFALKFLKNDGTEEWTDPIAYNGDTAAVQAGVDTALGGSIVVVAGTAITAMTFTFSGVGYAGKAQQLIGIDISGLTGEEDTNVAMTTAGGTGVNAAVNEVQTVAMAGGSAGTYTLTFTDHTGTSITTGDIAYNEADNAAVETIIETALGANTVSVGGTVHTAMTLTFDLGQYAGRPQAMVTIDATSWTGTSSAISRTTIGEPESSGDAYGIMAEDVTSGASEYPTANVVVRDAVYAKSGMDFGSGNMADAIEVFAAQGIIVRADL